MKRFLSIFRVFLITAGVLTALVWLLAAVVLRVGVKNYNTQQENWPKKGTAWESEDGKIYFEMKESDEAQGYILTPRGRLELRFVVTPHQGIFGHELEEGGRMYLEEWTPDYYAPDEFSAEVDASTVYDEGEMLHFRKVG